MEKEAEALRGSKICPRSHSLQLADAELEPRISDTLGWGGLRKEQILGTQGSQEELVPDHQGNAHHPHAKEAGRAPAWGRPEQDKVAAEGPMQWVHRDFS